MLTFILSIQKNGEGDINNSTKSFWLAFHFSTSQLTIPAELFAGLFIFLKLAS